MPIVAVTIVTATWNQISKLHDVWVPRDNINIWPTGNYLFCNINCKQCVLWILWLCGLYWIPFHLHLYDYTKVANMFSTSATCNKILCVLSIPIWVLWIWIWHTWYQIVDQNIWHYIVKNIFCSNDLHDSNIMVQNQVLEHHFKMECNMQPLLLCFLLDKPYKN